jgi:hypothetical protein
MRVGFWRQQVIGDSSIQNNHADLLNPAINVAVIVVTNSLDGLVKKPGKVSFKLKIPCSDVQNISASLAESTSMLNICSAFISSKIVTSN